jgi:glycosyltransferase involved in cell wall biosynthesis
MKYYLEVGPLKEKYYTGIAQVTAELAAQALLDKTRDLAFFVGRTLIGEDAVAEFLDTRDGELLDWHLHRRPMGVAPSKLLERNVAIFPNRKTCRHVFGAEFQIVHDFSTLLTPQYHHQETVDWHANSIEGDLRSNSATFCVSESTRQDVLAYFPELKATEVHTLHLASKLDAKFASKSKVPVEQYVLVLGTIEPRKNVTQILDFIRRNQDILARFRFVFPGRFGWGDEVSTLLSKFGLTKAFEEKRLLFPGFVAEEIKHLLYQNAYVVAYPSYFEGFGLPVLEALSHGAACITTYSSSLPEVAGDAAFYFNPFIDSDFDRAFNAAVEAMETRSDDVDKKARLQAAKFSWNLTYEKMMTVVDGRVQG